MPIIELKIKGRNFEYEVDGYAGTNPDIVVAEGDTVKVTFTSESGLHDWLLDEDGAIAKTERVGTGQTAEEIEFTATPAGNYPYYCSVHGHRNDGMEGLFIIE